MYRLPFPTRWACLLLTAASLLCVSACNENKSSPDQPTASLDSPANSPAPSVAAAPRSAAPAPRSVSAPPPDARYTLYCSAITGPNHAADADALRDQVMAVTHWKDWYVVHHDAESVLYYGYFKSIADPNQPIENRRAHSAITAVTGLTNRMGEHPFVGAMLVPLDSPDPEAPPQWNLCNAPADRYWSVEIGSYTGSPARKKAAVDAVRAARASGIEAYYYHGESASSVCVGAWPADAIERQEQSDIAASPADPQQTLMYVPGELADRIPSDIRDRDGKPIKVLTDKVVIRDPTMLKVLQDYPHFAVNGEESVQVVHGQENFQPSAPVVIPRHAPTALDPTPAPAATPTSSAPPPVETPAPTDGQLRSLDH